MIFWEVFLHSLKLPAKKPMFQLNRVDMHIILIYLFFLIFIISLPSFFNQLIHPVGMAEELNIIFFLIYFFIFSYIPITIAIILYLLLIALVGKWLAKLLQRKLHYATIWKLTTCAATIPFLIYTIIAFIYPVDDVYLLLSGIYIIILIVKMILVYPKRRKKN